MVPEHFKRNGRPKHPFHTQAEAREEAARSNKASAYRCKFCNCWHVGGQR